MNTVTIHDTGHGADRLMVESHWNGHAYTVNFGEGPAWRGEFFLQGDDAAQLRDEFDQLEELNPETEARELWFRVLGPYI